jgi:hypothetical protein
VISFQYPILESAVVFNFRSRNETSSSSAAAVIVTVYASENFSSERIRHALVQVLQSAYSSLTFDIERYGRVILNNDQKYILILWSYAHSDADGCHAEDDIILEWPETEIGHSITLPCPCQDLIGNPATQKRSLNITRRCGGNYSMGGHWEEEGYQTQCGLTDIAIELCKANIVSLQ